MTQLALAAACLQTSAAAASWISLHECLVTRGTVPMPAGINKLFFCVLSRQAVRLTPFDHQARSRFCAPSFSYSIPSISSGSGDGTGTSARFLFPHDIARAVDGNFHIADSSYHVIRFHSQLHPTVGRNKLFTRVKVQTE